MSKRRLNTQQTRRIDHHQRRQAARADSPAARNDHDKESLGPEQNGLILSNFGAAVEVQRLNEADADQVYFCHLRANLQALVAGDRVVWRRGEPTGVVVAQLPRSSELLRPDRRGRPRTVAANVDRLMLVIAPQPEPHANLIDRYLIAASHTGIDVSIAVNKVDLFEEDTPLWLEDFEALYTSLGYPMLRTSTRRRDGLDSLRQALNGKTTVLVGQSGVGKSSLIAALLPDQKLRIAPLSDNDSKGRHTTTGARLYHLPDGGMLIDSPGIREFTLLHLDPTTLAQGFVEMRPWLGRCQFRDCQHLQETGCAVTDAVDRGLISHERHASYCQILADNRR